MGHRVSRPDEKKSIPIDNQPIAIVGIGCRFPGRANSPRELSDILLFVDIFLGCRQPRPGIIYLRSLLSSICDAIRAIVLKEVIR
jgi:hypothetical protein